MTQLPIEDVAAAIEAVARLIRKRSDDYRDIANGDTNYWSEARAISNVLYNLDTPIRALTNQIACPSGGEGMPKVHHLGAALQGIADEHANVLTPRQIEALYQAAKKLWSPPDPAVGATVSDRGIERSV